MMSKEGTALPRQGPLGGAPGVVAGLAIRQLGPEPVHQAPVGDVANALRFGEEAP